MGDALEKQKAMIEQWEKEQRTMKWVLVLVSIIVIGPVLLLVGFGGFAYLASGTKPDMPAHIEDGGR